MGSSDRMAIYGDPNLKNMNTTASGPETSPSMNDKAFEGLSLPGLAAHIASSILLWNNGRGTRNDCKHAIAPNVRAFQRRLIALQETCEVWITSKALVAEKREVELEHAIPVGCLMNLLFWKVKTSDVTKATAEVDTLIRENTVLVWVTKDEHAELNKKYQSKMPEGFDTYPWKCRLARYTQTPSVSELRKWIVVPDPSKPLEDDLDSEMEDDF
jgi:hypothetical protein